MQQYVTPVNVAEEVEWWLKNGTGRAPTVMVELPEEGVQLFIELTNIAQALDVLKAFDAALCAQPDCVAALETLRRLAEELDKREEKDENPSI